MPTATDQLIKLFSDGQTQMLDYLRRADERGERQSRATLKALGAIQDGQKTLQAGQTAIQAGQIAIQAGQGTIAEMLGEITRMSADVAFMANEARREAKESKERVIDLAASTRKH